MGRKKECTTVYFEPSTLERLRRLQQATKVPTSVRVRDAVEAHLTALEAKHADELAALPPVEEA